MNLHLRLCLWVVLSFLGVTSAYTQPSISGFSPISGYPGMPSQITITGSGFATGSGNIVRFNGVLAAASSPAAGQIQATVPVGATTGRITVQVGNNTANSLQDFVVGPFIQSFSPITGGIGTTVVIQGAQFAASPGMKLTFAGTNATFTFNSANQITAVVPNGAMTGPLTVTITSGVTKGTNTTITNFFVPPVITKFVPASAQAGSNVNIFGRSFAGLTAVRVGSANATIVSSSQTNIVFTVPNNAVTGKISIDAPPNSTITTSNFVVIPTVLGFSPSKGNVGTNVIITGLSFIPIAGSNTVKFNGTTATIIGTPSITSITSTVPAGATSGLISVKNTNGTAFSVTNFYLPPSIASATPTAGSAGTLVAITGQNLTNGTAVTFNGVSANLFTNINNTRIDVVAPVGAGTGRIVVTNPGGSATNAILFSYPPVIATFTPASGLPGTNVTINGVNFTNASAVKFAGSNASFTIVNDGKITAIVPANAITGAISVTGPGGTAVSSSLFFIDTVSLTVQWLTNLVSVTWPANTIGFTLQDTTNLLSTNTVWLAVTNPPIILQNGVNTYTNVPDASARFFRLTK